MKVLFISSPFFADCNFPLIQALQKSGHDVTYMIRLTPYSMKSTLFNIKKLIHDNSILPASAYQELKVYNSYMDLSKTFVINQLSSRDTSFSAFCLFLNVVKFITKGHYDVIHTDNIFGMWYQLLYVFFRKKLLLTVHDPFPHTGESNTRKTFAYKVAMRYARRFVILNERQKEDFISTYHINPSQIFTNKLGVYDNISFLKQLDIEQDPYNVLFFGRISPYKGVEYLCRAMVEVRKSIPKATLTIAGGGNFYFDIDTYKQYDWITIHNRFIGIEELALLLQKSRVSVCPYVDATQSGVIMTSYGMCRPVIASNVGGLAEMVDNGLSGIVVSPQNTAELAQAIIRILSDAKLYDDMQHYIISEYYQGEKSWNAIAGKYIKIYDMIKRNIV